jgi:hypothetical protein
LCALTDSWCGLRGNADKPEGLSADRAPSADAPPLRAGAAQPRRLIRKTLKEKRNASPRSERARAIAAEARINEAEAQAEAQAEARRQEAEAQAEAGPQAVEARIKEAEAGRQAAEARIKEVEAQAAARIKEAEAGRQAAEAGRQAAEDGRQAAEAGRQAAAARIKEAESGRQVAEAGRQAAATRIKEVEAQAAARIKEALEVAAAARRAAGASEKLLTFMRLACVTVTSADAMLQVILVEDEVATLAGLPEVHAARLAELFRRLDRPTLPSTAPERTLQSGGGEVSVQAFVALLLSDIISFVGSELKVLSERVVSPLSARPDHVVVRERDASAELSNSLIVFEDTPPEANDAAKSTSSEKVRQGTLDAVGYVISRVEHLRNTFPSADTWTAFAVFTNGRSVRVFRVWMETSADGVVTTGVLATPLLPLSGGAAGEVPEGFAALVRLLSASPAQLCELAIPPWDVCMRVAGAPLQLEERLGTGGFTNVYAASFEGVAAVVKCAHVGGRTPLARAGLAREASILRALNAARCPGVPQFLAEGDLSASPAPPGTKAARALPSAVPFLVLAPRGAPLCALAAATRSDEERLALAHRVAADVLRALRGAHAAGFVHGDVRPSNVVLDAAGGGGAQLVDWGAARRLGERGNSRWGTMPFVADQVAMCFTPVELG